MGSLFGAFDSVTDPTGLKAMLSPTYCATHPLSENCERRRQPLPPKPPEPPRMTESEVRNGIVQVADYFESNPASHWKPQQVMRFEMQAALGKVPPAGRKLLELAISDDSVRNGLAQVVRDGYANDSNVSMNDLRAARSYRPGQSQDLDRAMHALRTAIRTRP